MVARCIHGQRQRQDRAPGGVLQMKQHQQKQQVLGSFGVFWGRSGLPMCARMCDVRSCGASRIGVKTRNQATVVLPLLVSRASPFRPIDIFKYSVY
jgi:hypothetical protein